MSDRTNPSPETRAAEREEASAPHQSDREPTQDQEAEAEGLELDPDVSAHEREMAERGKHQQGEGRI